MPEAEVAWRHLAQMVSELEILLPVYLLPSCNGVAQMSLWAHPFLCETEQHRPWCRMCGGDQDRPVPALGELMFLFESQQTSRVPEIRGVTG